MKLSRKTGIALFVLAVFVEFLAQYPLFKYHAGNWDHYFILFLSNTISETGRAHWIANWSSYFGLHRISYPQGVPFLFSFFQQLSGDTTETLVMVYSYLEGFMAVLFSFSLGLLIRKKDYLFAFFFSFLFSTAPSYLYVTQWTLSARGLFVTLLALFVFLNLYILARKTEINKFVFLNILFLILLFSIHRMAFFMIATVFPAMLLIYIIYSNRFLAINKRLSSLNKKYKIIIIIVVSIIFSYLLVSFYTQKPMIERINQSLSQGKIFSGDSLYVKIANLGLSFLASGGILVVFVLIPLNEIIKTKKTDYNQIYFLFIVLFLILIIFYPSYFRPYSSLFLSFFIATFLIMIYYKKPISIKKFNVYFKKSVPALLVFSLIFSMILQAKWDGSFESTSKQWMDYKQEEAICAIKDNPSNNVFISSVDISRLARLYSGKFSIPPGAYKYDYYMYIFTKRPYLLSPNNLNMTLYLSVDWGGEIYLYKEHPLINKSIYEIYNLSFYDILESKSRFSESTSISNASITNKMYLIYSNGIYDIYLVNPVDEEIQRTHLYFYRP